MKKYRILTFLLVLLILFSFSSCRETLPFTTIQPPPPKPTRAPTTVEKIASRPIVDSPYKYLLPVGASPDQMRLTALQAMVDQLSIRWTPKEDMEYSMTANGTFRSFQFKKGRIYAGLPYTEAGTGLLSFLEYYDVDTGIFEPDKRGWEKRIGNSCATIVTQSWATVCTSVRVTGTVYMTPENGSLPVGEYEYKLRDKSQSNKGTNAIVQQNGDQVMYRSYAALKAGYGVVTYELDKALPNNHARMVYENPVVVRNADGTINPGASYITFIEQTGNQQFGQRVVDGITVNQIGAIGSKFTFLELYQTGYIPVAPAEFLGGKPYIVPTVTIQINTEEPNETEEIIDITGTKEGLIKGIIFSPYRVVAVAVSIANEAGEELIFAKKMTELLITKTEDFYPFEMRSLASGLGLLPEIAKLEAGTYRYKVMVQLITGSVVTATEWDFTI